ncbi:MAG: rod shape-determining protein MreD [Candidatus Caldatribacteriota bacterium]|nr:rod shape-determining protein MreD [Candidatus Caldatribacteriota bacterium]
MNNLFKGGIIAVTLLIQLTILNSFTLQGLKPDLILIVVIVFALVKGAGEGGIVGFGSGLLQDIFSVGLLGVNAFVKTVVGFLCGILKERIFVEHILFIIPLITLLVSIVENGLIFLVLRAFGMEYSDLILNLKQIIIPEAFYNSILSPFIYLGVKKLLQIIDDKF